MTPPSRTALLSAFAAVYFIWGSTYLAMRVGVAAIPPFLLGGVRFLLAGAAFAGWARWRGAARPTRHDWRSTAVIGCLMAAGGTGVVGWALQTLPSGLGALLVGMVPLWIALIDWLRPGGRRPPGRVLLGLVLGFGGVALLVDPTAIGGVRQVDLVGALAVVGATALWASGSVYSRYARQPESQALSAGMQMLAGAALLLLLSALTGELRGLEWAAVPARAYAAWLYLLLLGSVAYASYLWLLKASTPAKASTYAYVNPVIALLLGYFIGDEILTAWTLGCSGVVLAAVLLVVSR